MKPSPLICPLCHKPIFIGLSGIARCLSGHILSIPPEFTLAIELSNMPASWHSKISVDPITPIERTPVHSVFQEAFEVGELEV